MKNIASLLTTMLLLVTGLAHAAQENVDYTVLKHPIAQLQNNKVEVLEFFSYQCIHCYYLNSILARHSKTFAADTYLRRSHVVWGPNFYNLARIAVAVNNTHSNLQADATIFHAIFEKNIDLSNPDVFKSWVVQQKNFNGKKVLAAYLAPNNKKQAQNMGDFAKQAQVMATPTVIVGGKYQLQFPQGFEQGMKTMDELIAKVRHERGLQAVNSRKVPRSIGASLAISANH